MESETPNLREQGVQALRDGNVDDAVDLLARAVMANGQDAEALAFLGVAYSQKGQHPQAKRALETAVELVPQEVRYHFNLGVALEMASDWNGAAHAYRRVLQLQREHPLARAKLQALSDKLAGPSGPEIPVQSAPATVPLGHAPWLAGGSAPSAAPAGPAGTVECGQCKQWSKPGLSCEWCSAPLRSVPGVSSAGAYGASSVGYLGSPTALRADYEDRMDLLQCLTDWLGVLSSPHRFFSDQVGCEGVKAPLGFLLTYSLISTLMTLVPFATGQMPGMSTLPGVGLAVVGVVILLLGIPITILFSFVWAGIVHGICKMFGGQAGYSGTFRATTYALAPLPIFGLASILISAASGPPTTPGFPPRTGSITVPGSAQPRLVFARSRGFNPAVRSLAAGDRFGSAPNASRAGLPMGPGGSPFGRTSPLATLISLLGVGVYLVFMGIGVAHIHCLSTGGAVGVAVISGIATVVMFVLFVIILGVGIAALAVAGSRGFGH
jgi:hypothetical protein